MATISLARKLEPGIKRLKIMSIDEKFGPSGYTYLTMQMEVTRGPEKGLTFSERLSLSPAARFRVNQFLDAIEAPQTGSADSSDFVNKYLWADVELQAQEGYDPRPGVKKYLLQTDVEETQEDMADLLEEQASLENQSITQATIAELADDDDDPFNVPMDDLKPKKNGSKKKEELAEIAG